MEDRIQILVEGNQTWIVRDALEATARMIIGQPCEMLGQVLTTDGRRCYFSIHGHGGVRRLTFWRISAYSDLPPFLYPTLGLKPTRFTLVCEEPFFGAVECEWPVFTGMMSILDR